MDAIDRSDFNQRLYTFLSEYVDFPEGPLTLPEGVMVKAIQMIVEFGVMTKDEMKKEALQEQLIIIPDAYFNKEEL